MEQDLTKYTPDTLAQYSQEFLQKVDALRNAIFEKRKEISSVIPPKEKVHRFGERKKQVSWNDLEYIDEDWMREKLTELFIWSWEGNGSLPLQVFPSIGQVSFTGTLEIIDNGIIRRFTACAGSAIKLKKDMPISVGAIVNFSNDCKAANTDALKKAINMLTNIGDPVYGKSMLVETDPELKLELQTLYSRTSGQLRKLFDDTLNNNYGGTLNNIPDDMAITMINQIKSELDKQEQPQPIIERNE